MTDRKRDPLPSCYQFGDAAAFLNDEAMCQLFFRRYVEPAMDDLRARVRNGHTDEDDRRMLRYLGWNVIEGEHFSADIANYVPKLGD